MQVNGEILAPAAVPWWKGSRRIGAVTPKAGTDAVPEQNSSQASGLNYGQGRQNMIAPRQTVTKRLGLPCREVNPRRQTCSLVTVPPIREKDT